MSLRLKTHTLKENALSSRRIDDRVATMLSEPYLAYSYSYPHKSAYGALDPHVSLEELWQAERRENLFLYVHLPFCEMRCGFCNLFARTIGDNDVLRNYLQALERQTRVLERATRNQRSISRLAIGGGTPTVLSVAELEQLFHLLDKFWGVAPKEIPTSIETSPKTATPERLALLKSLGVARISMGVQSFVENEVHEIGRPQTNHEVHRALQNIHQAGFPILNIDLIYGQPSQTLQSWLESIEEALIYQPEEVFLYPLYIRPQTGLGRRNRVIARESNFYQACYFAARAKLLDCGYDQGSMRYFRKRGSLAEDSPNYCCQTDGMLGLGCGARSYTSRLHYSDRFAVTGAAVSAILDRWMQQTAEEFAFANWGAFLTDDERKRRFIIQSLLHHDGLSVDSFETLFAQNVEQAFPQIEQFAEIGLIHRRANQYLLTEQGLAWSDAIGPAFYSDRCSTALRKFTPL